MNRYDHLINEYIKTSKSVALEKIGVFTVSNEPFVLDNNTISGQQKIDFKYDKKAETTPELIDFIASSLTKSKGIVAADVESYLIEVRQWINISKAYILEGLGEIAMNNNGLLVFNQAANLSPKEEENRRKHANQVTQETYTEKRRNKKGGVFAFAVIIVLLILSGAGWGIYSLLMQKNKTGEPAANEQKNTVTPDTPVAVKDTSAALNTVPDTAVSRKPDSLKQAATPASDSTRYKFIFETTGNRERAITRTELLRVYGNNCAYDSVKNGPSSYTYRLYIDAKIPVSDTTRTKDSLAKYLDNKKIIIRKF